MARTPTHAIPMCLPGFLTRWQLSSKDEAPEGEEAREGEEIFIAFYDLTLRSQRVTSAAFCSPRKSRTSASFRAGRKTPLVGGG